MNYSQKTALHDLSQCSRQTIFFQQDVLRLDVSKNDLIISVVSIGY